MKKYFLIKLLFIVAISIIIGYSICYYKMYKYKKYNNKLEIVNKFIKSDRDSIFKELCDMENYASTRDAAINSLIEQLHQNEENKINQ